MRRWRHGLGLLGVRVPFRSGLERLSGRGVVFGGGRSVPGLGRAGVLSGGI